MGRFINADGIIGANGDILSYNLYAYVSNNPIMYSDPTGESAVQLIIIGLKTFLPKILNLQKTEEEAAKDFAERHAYKTKETGNEFSSAIYEINLFGKRMYGYTKPIMGTNVNAYVGQNLKDVPLFTKVTAYVHTHPRTNNFSVSDRNAAAHYRINAYVATPSNELLRNIPYGNAPGVNPVQNLGTFDPYKYYFKNSWSLGGR